jgi:hypothetical protein
LHFRFLFKKAKEVIDLLGNPKAISPYSVIPLISQAIGLEIPMMGTGKSPYSIISYFSKLDNNLFQVNERRLPYKKNNKGQVSTLDKNPLR